MAKEAKITWVADASQAVKENQKLERQVTQLREKLGAVRRTSQSAGREGKTAFRGMGDEVGSLILRFGTLSYAVGQVKEMFGAVDRQLRQVAKTGEEAVGTLQKTVAGAGDIAVYGDIEKRLYGMKGVGFLGMKERGAVYGAVRGALPTAPLERVMRLTGLAARSVAISGDVGMGAQLGGVMGELSKIMPGAAPGDIADVGILLQQATGKWGGQLDLQAFKGVQQLVGQGVGPAEALGLLLAGAQSAQGARGLSSLASWVEQERRGGMAVTMPAILTRAAGGGARVPAPVQALLAEYGRRDYAGMVTAAQREDIFEGQIGVALTTPDIRLNLKRMRARASKSLAEYAKRQEALETETAVDFYEAAALEQGVTPYSREKSAKWIRRAAPYVGEEWAMRVFAGASGRDIEAYRRFENEPTISAQEAYGPVTAKLESAATRLESSSRNLDQATHALPRPPTRRNRNAGAMRDTFDDPPFF